MDQGNANISYDLMLPKEDCECYSFHLVLFSEADEMYNLWLPRVPEGFFYFSANQSLRFLSISAKDGRWIATCQRPAYFQNGPLTQCGEIVLSDELLLKIDVEDQIYFLYVENSCKNQMIFYNYSVATDETITIGSHAENDICYMSPHISAKCAVLKRAGDQWSIQSYDDVGGVYVNGEKQNYAALSLGDVISILGLRMIVGLSFISINGGNKLIISKRLFHEVSPIDNRYSGYPSQDIAEGKNHYFNRPPRRCVKVEEKTIAIEGPPISMNRAQLPLMLRMGSSMVMGGTAALAGNFTMLLTMILFPLISSKYTDKQRQEYEALRITKYQEYLEKKRLEITAVCQEEARLLNEKYPALSVVADQLNSGLRLWERRPVDDDFLRIRLGAGEKHLGVKINYPEKHFELEQDELEDKMYALAEAPYILQNVPVLLSIMDTRVCALQGDRKQVIEYISKLVMQVAILHSYDEVKMFFLLCKEELGQLDFLRYLPHTWDDQQSIRFVATSDAEAYKLGEYLKGQITEELGEAADLKKILRRRPYYIIFDLNKRLFESHDFLTEILQAEHNHGVSFLIAHDDIPKETQKIITLESDQQNTYTSLEPDGGNNVVFSLDHCSTETVLNSMYALANIKLKAITRAQEMPKMITFLEMMGVGRVEQLNSQRRWHENNPVVSLAAPVGIEEDGSLFVLDLHEKRHGPHGLVAGMTGSGKSEFIITYILSMAVNYHPDEVAFVLIDYKGGGLAGAFDNAETGIRLPHLVGTITNLDGASIHRSLQSIESELLRRQTVFSKIKGIINEGTMDIYEYQKLYRAGKVSEPMPHLFIISDEFAELKQQQPEFMSKLISAARIGRSLGIHLILATQKPSGVVDDQIRSNSKFRVCLRVQERSDSMDMLKRPDAAELTNTGRFYLQVGYNEYYTLGQSAWCGAPYEPQDTVLVRKDNAIEFLDTTGQVIYKANPKVKKVDSGTKQIVAIVKYLSDTARTYGIAARQLWQPELPRMLDIDALQDNESRQGMGMVVRIGMLDDPERQEQFPLEINFESCKNILVAGASGCGKTTLIQSILYSLIKKLSPQEFNFYILDYSSRMMKQLNILPHCGEVLYEEDADSLDDFFKLIYSIISERKKLFSQLGVDSFEAARSIQSLPLILVVIDNISGLNLSKAGENLFYKLPSYLKDSAHYGVKYVITCNHLNEVSLKIRNELDDRICLFLKDKYDCSEVLGCKISCLPLELPGRGLYKYKGKPLEFQCAILQAGVDEATRTASFNKMLRRLCAQCGTQVTARRIPVCSDSATYAEFAAQFKLGRIPLGYSKPSGKPVALPLKQFSALSLYFGNPTGKIPVMENMIYAAIREGMELWIVKRREGSYFNGSSGYSSAQNVPSNVKIFDLGQGSLESFRDLLTTQIISRKEIVESYCERNNLNKEAEDIYKLTFSYLRASTTPVMLIFESFADFCRAVDNISALIFSKSLTLTQKRNIYAVACFEEDDDKLLENRLLYDGFNPDRNILLLGGKFDKQTLCTLSDMDGGKTLPYNVGIMHYRYQYHPILMPCGELINIDRDEDEESIF